MFPTELDVLVSQEQHKDWLRAIEKERLGRAAGLVEPAPLWKSGQKMIYRLLNQVTRWSTSPSEPAVISNPGCCECC